MDPLAKTMDDIPDFVPNILPKSGVALEEFDINKYLQLGVFTVYYIAIRQSDGEEIHKGYICEIEYSLENIINKLQKKMAERYDTTPKNIYIQVELCHKDIIQTNLTLDIIDDIHID